jgi:tetratricopeptide (TPR) repeat protein
MQARYAEAVKQAQDLCANADPSTRARAEALWGTALSLEGADLAEAAEHLQKAAALLRGESAPVDTAQLAQVIFELGSVAAQQGDLPKAIALYQEALTAAESAQPDVALPQRILAHNNLAYHLHLLDPHDPQASEHAHLGLRLAQEKGLLGLQTFLLSTLGEIALAHGDLEAAESISDGLALARALSIQGSIAGARRTLAWSAFGAARPRSPFTASPPPSPAPTHWALAPPCRANSPVARPALAARRGPRRQPGRKPGVTPESGGGRWLLGGNQPPRATGILLTLTRATYPFVQPKRPAARCRVFQLIVDGRASDGISHT